MKERPVQGPRLGASLSGHHLLDNSRVNEGLGGPARLSALNVAALCSGWSA